MKKTKKKIETLEDLKDILINLKPELERKYKIKEIGILGSWVKGRQRKKTDVDILIDFYEKPDLFTFIEIEEYLSRKLKRKVDLVLKSALKPYIGQIILQEVIYL